MSAAECIAARRHVSHVKVGASCRNQAFVISFQELFTPSPEPSSTHEQEGLWPNTPPCSPVPAADHMQGSRSMGRWEQLLGDCHEDSIRPQVPVQVRVFSGGFKVNAILSVPNEALNKILNRYRADKLQLLNYFSRHILLCYFSQDGKSFLQVW